jgi:hypothetical protein
LHGRVHTAQLLGAVKAEFDLNDVHPVDHRTPLGHEQRGVAIEGFFEEGPSAAFPMGLHQCSLKRGVPPFGRRRSAPTGVIIM